MRRDRIILVSKQKLPMIHLKLESDDKFSQHRFVSQQSGCTIKFVYDPIIFLAHSLLHDDNLSLI